MKHVLGIGGIFFKAQDPEKLAAWYREHLGLDVEEYGGVTFVKARTRMKARRSVRPTQSGRLFPRTRITSPRAANLS